MNSKRHNLYIPLKILQEYEDSGRIVFLLDFIRFHLMPH